MAGPLEGFTVVDLSAVVSGPLTGALLADQGAGVIKVERVGGGDIQRQVGSQRNGFSGFFHVLNRGKRSIATDLGTEEGRRIVHALAARADVVIQNFRPGVVERLGIGFDDLSAINAGLVYLSISGFGQTGPRSGDRAYDPIIQAYSGIGAVQGRIHRENPEMPEQVNMLLLDKLTAWTGCQAVTAALLARSRTGKGQHIELSMLDTAIAFIWSDTAADLILQGEIDDPRPPVGASGSVHQLADAWGVTMTLHQEEFVGFCRALGLADIPEDPRFASLQARTRHRQELAAILAERAAPAAASLQVADAEAAMKREDVPFARFRKLNELEDDPQVRHNGMLRRRHHPVAGELQEARPAPLFTGTPLAMTAPAPVVGQHTREILGELGLGAHYDDWLSRRVIA
ncbi:MAG: CoA transferase [Pseudomonadales bacterium]